MRTLLVDNYDSFTYNLFHYLAEVNGREPEVVTNDDPFWKTGRLAEFGNVVLSPGPGTPEREADFGICADILRHGTLPTLGVCLGHQGIAVVYGGEVCRAPEPRHGRVSPVLHGGTGLFEGLPSPLTAVRYHSLAVGRPPASLEVTARTADGTIMGLRHRELPLWGVQFHPESVGSAYGHRILDNFRRMSERHGVRRKHTRPFATTVRTPEATPGETSEATPEEQSPRRTLQVLTAALPTHWDDEVVFDRLFRRGPHAYWLDSSRRDGSNGRFSVMGDASGPLARIACADVDSSTVIVRSRHATEVVTGGFLDWLARDLCATRTETPALPCGFALGWVGYLGYGLKAECGGEPGHRSDEPDATMVFADRALVLDHATGTTHLLALTEDGDESAARSWLDATARKLSALAGLRPFPAGRPGALGALHLRHDRDAYLRLINACREQIAAGETYEVCLTNMAEATGTLDPWAGYRFLRRTSPAPFGALLSFDGLSVLSTSPERFLRIDREGRAESSPIKGTRPRGATPQQDALLAADLAASEKDRAENLMIVDLVRNDLGRCAQVGSVEAKDVFRVESYAKAHQLVSTVRATLRPDRSPVDCVRAAFPPGSMTGAPKIRTMQIIERLEQGPRGVYSGAIGYFSLSGAVDLSVVIRTAVVTVDRVRYGVGGAIIALSDPEEEYEETAVKAAPLTALTGTDFPDRHGTRDRVSI
ncbi:aminodeoxychorismate synthase component I [Streptomyces hiroshimensis]|uniref:aminodeoxychorismate synthase n=1 Tax=Streptomyces hiroshimensis TaxID=66424 RepID=A0ABQ2Y301_9ACTN|nr:aminodeoxychorismate synthase component I [Streptomyces hiroshimensis]GGX60408.1 aminodeoxychorismate synthase, component I [Streptomyces hiroshimensis]